MVCIIALVNSYQIQMWDQEIRGCSVKFYWIFLSDLFIVIAALPNGRLVGGEGIVARSNLHLGRGSVRIKTNKNSSSQISLISIKNVIRIGCESQIRFLS